ncbi:MAG: hypothetical protein AAFP98_00870 [Pseudomonadota bacterium]
MSKMKTSIFLLFFAAPPAGAFTDSADDQLMFFASCAGRLSATMEHQWIYDTASADATRAQRTEMIDLVSAVMPAERGRDVLRTRIAAKHAQAGLLTRAQLSWDATEANWAEARADALLSECTSILIGADTE